MKFFLISIFLIAYNIHADFKNIEVESLKVSDSTIHDFAEILSRTTDISVTATSEAGVINCSLFLKKSNLLNTIEILCRSSKLAYRLDMETSHILIMTMDEYRQGIYLNQTPQIRVFNTRPANLSIIAQSIANLFGERVNFSQGQGVRDFKQIEENATSSSANSSSSNTNSSTSSSSNISNSGTSGSNSSSSGSNSETDIEALRKSIDFSLIRQIERARMNAKPGESPQQIILNRLLPEKPVIQLSINHEHSMILLRSTDIEALDEIAFYIQKTDKKVPQVLLEMKILELTIGDDFQSIFDYDIRSLNQNTFDPNGTTPLIGNEGVIGAGINKFATQTNTLIFDFISDRVRAQMQLLESTNNVETLATPMLIAANNREANIDIVTNEVFTTGFTLNNAIFDDNGNIVQPSQIIPQTNLDSVGTKLKIMPSINKDNTVTLYIEQETSSKIINGGKIFFDGADRNIDTKSERKITATVLAKDRHTIAIGGLITTSYEDTIDKTPILGDIPLLGFFFRKEIKKEVKKEIVLLITPYIMNDATEGEHVTGDVMNKNSNHSFHTEGVNGIDKKNKNLQNRINDQQQAK